VCGYELEFAFEAGFAESECFSATHSSCRSSFRPFFRQRMFGGVLLVILASASLVFAQCTANTCGGCNNGEGTAPQKKRKKKKKDFFLRRHFFHSQFDVQDAAFGASVVCCMSLSVATRMRSATTPRATAGRITPATLVSWSTVLFTTKTVSL
jgi:hypothetical protein